MVASLEKSCFSRLDECVPSLLDNLELEQTESAELFELSVGLTALTNFGGCGLLEQ